MTVSSTSNRVVYSGNASTTSFPFAFKVQSAADLVVVFTDATGTDFTLSPSQYGAVGFGLDAGGTVTYPISGAPIAFGTKLTIYRDVAATQPAAISNQGAMWPSVIEAALDRATYVLQKIADSVSRALVISPTDSGTLKPLPNATQRANSVLGFDGTGQPYAAQLVAGLGSASAWLVSNFFPMASAAAARGSIGALAAADNIAFTGTNTHAGVESFTVSPVIPTPAAGDTSTKAASTAFVAVAAPKTRQIFGWTYANNGTNNLDIAAGGGSDSTNAVAINVGALTKQTNIAWAAGTNAGMLDTVTVADTDYYIWAISTAAGVGDYLSSLSSTAPTMPSTYVNKRLIGWFKRVSGAVVAFNTYEIEGGGLEFLWNSPTLDVNTAALTTSRRTDAVKVPLNFSTLVFVNVQVINGASPAQVRINCPDQADLAVPSATTAPLGNVGYVTASGGQFWQLRLRTDATGKIAARASGAVATYAVVTEGFVWARR